MMRQSFHDCAALTQEISGCRLCAQRFAATATRHAPRPVVWFRPSARILIAGQAPGLRVHDSGRPYTDASGDRLRQWLGVSEDVFYDRDQIAIVPMAFCFPGYNAKKADLPPPPECAIKYSTKHAYRMRLIRRHSPGLWLQIKRKMLIKLKLRLSQR